MINVAQRIVPTNKKTLLYIHIWIRKEEMIA
jgi:hypothetical protein